MNADGTKGDSLGRLLLLAVVLIVLLDRWYPVDLQRSATPMPDATSSLMPKSQPLSRGLPPGFTEDVANVPVTLQASRGSWVF
ncbi:hypothetical protein [Pseudomonas citronellolis]|uniref:hypothetical protein n=1 Tax=Pseudomonas citronellolis TaxID=53408 RepID=UPI0023E42F84|nr:hypothetical protein [Pseudomonas citronellolis]MDF3931842.1 hypothetical protein [Pseudomonas citronellolis]